MKQISLQFFASKATLNSQQLCKIEQTIGYRFSNHSLLVQAFTRASYRNEHPDQPDNEVLELIGDSVLSLTVLTYFKQVYTQTGSQGLLTNWNEGKLSALKSSVVSKKPLAQRMRQLQLQQYLLTSRGDMETGIHCEDSVLEDLFESIIGAIYVDSGENFSQTATVVRHMLDISEMVQAHQNTVHISYRNDLQEWCQDKKRGLTMPVYTEKNLPDGSFGVTVHIPETELCGSGSGRNTKQARENAAKDLLDRLEKLPPKSFFRPEIKAENYVGLLQEHAQKKKLPPAEYADAGEEMLQDKSYRFYVECRFCGKKTVASAPSKREAKQQAAAKMLKSV